MVMANPIQFTMVSDAPFAAGGALLATSVENNGESAITAIHQIKRKKINKGVEFIENSKGETREQIQKMSKAAVATRLGPSLNEINPLSTQAIVPAAIIKNENSGTLSAAPGTRKL